MCDDTRRCLHCKGYVQGNLRKKFCRSKCREEFHALIKSEDRKKARANITPLTPRPCRQCKQLFVGPLKKIFCGDKCKTIWHNALKDHRGKSRMFNRFNNYGPKKDKYVSTDPKLFGKGEPPNVKS